jgi:MFS family permease
MTSQTSSVHSPWLILTFLCLPVFLGAIDLTIVSAILPEVMVSLGLPPESRLDDAFWAITGYLLAYTISMVFVGKLSDMIGRRQVYIACLLLFMFGSYFVVVAHTYPAEWYARLYREINPDVRPPAEELRVLHMIILGRVLQALGAGAMVPVAMAMVGDLFPPAKRATPIGVIGAVDTVGWVLGHLYGGVVVKFFGDHGDGIVNAFADVGMTIAEPTWRTLFWFNLLFGLVTLVVMAVTLRGVVQTRSKQPFDFLGTLLIVLALIALNLGLGNSNPETPASASDFQTQADSSTFALPLLVIFVIAFSLFLLVETRIKYPLVDLGLFRDQNVSAAAISNIAVGFCLTIGLVTLPILVNIREGESDVEGIQQAALIAGILLSSLTIPMAVAALPGAWLSDRFGYRVAIVTGMILSAGGFASMGLTWQRDTLYWLMSLQMGIAGIGLGLTISPIGTAVINAVSADERGSASAMVLALRLVGMTLALSSLTDFAINRVNKLVSQYPGEVVDAGILYLDKTVDVVQELFFLGVVLSLLTILLTWRMKGGQVQQNPETPY